MSIAELLAMYGQLFAAFSHVDNVARYVWFIVLPPVLYFIFRIVWTDYITDVFFGNTTFEVMEIIPPQNIEMSPRPMELIFAGIEGIYSTPSSYDALCEGITTYSFSFELAGIDGKVHFYVRYPAQFRNLLESHIYAQYPDVELRQVPDYTRSGVPDIVPNKEWDLWGSDLELVAPDPVPIKTWESFEEDVTGKMIDPLAGLVETMGRMRKGEQLWLQIIATPQKETWYNTGKAYAEELKGKAAKPQKGLLGRVMHGLTGFLGSSGGGEKSAAEEAPLEFRLSAVEKKVLEAIEENIGRYVFEVKMRVIYVGRRDVFSKTTISSFFGALKQFADFNLNSFKPNDASKTYANYVARKTRLRYKQRLIIDRYRKRNTAGVTFFLSDRELATIYHMPDMRVAAPALPRAGAVRASAPANLPIKQ